MIMAELLDLERFRRKLAADQGFHTWLARFQEQFGPDTRLQDLSPSTLLTLASPGEETLYIYFDLIMGIRRLGGSLRFRLDDLEVPIKLKIMDTAFALMDRVRFEVMRRLGWVEEGFHEDIPIVDLVQKAWTQTGAFSRELPRLAASHPDYEKYRRLNSRDRITFIRRLIPRAVEAFRHSQEPDPA
jgi:hypothetical protein